MSPPDKTGTIGAVEVNFDSLVGLTHNYAGLAHGNLLSSENAGQVAHPRQAALQGLQKMRMLRSLGLTQGVLPPQVRPDLDFLRALGLDGDDPAAILARADREAPRLLALASSSSSMWAANAATVSPAADSGDGRVHLTTANLVTNAHRVIEAEQTTRTLRAIFADESRFVVHPALPSTPEFADEGAANHTRLASAHGQPGVALFVYGRSGPAGAPRRFPARQTLEACQAIARMHGLNDQRVIYARQHPDAIDAGVFHNDVIAVGNGPVLLAHEQAFADRDTTIGELRGACERLGFELIHVEVPADAVPLELAVKRYLFNSQLVTLPEGSMALIAPTDCKEEPAIVHTIDGIVADPTNPIGAAQFVDVRQSMQNGGGPACLRLRVVLAPADLQAVKQGVVLTDELGQKLEGWIGRHYRETLAPGDLADPKLLEESRWALDELTGILGLGSIYPFQKAAVTVW
ncbi:MAG: N-succinylarginine dihydrolase [Phycisphaerales bacterium JB060]